MRRPLFIEQKSSVGCAKDFSVSEKPSRATAGFFYAHTGVWAALARSPRGSCKFLFTPLVTPKKYENHRPKYRTHRLPKISSSLCCSQK